MLTKLKKKFFEFQFPHFRAVVQDGANIYAHREIGVAACSVVACSNNEFKSCGRRLVFGCLRRVCEINRR